MSERPAPLAIILMSRLIGIDGMLKQAEAFRVKKTIGNEKKGRNMNTTVIVTLKPTVLDPQGLTIHRNLQSAGISGVTRVRQGKYFDVEIRDDLNETDRQTLVERLAKDVLTNPVIESYRIVWEP